MTVRTSGEPHHGPETDLSADASRYAAPNPIRRADHVSSGQHQPVRDQIPRPESRGGPLAAFASDGRYPHVRHVSGLAGYKLDR